MIFCVKSFLPVSEYLVTRKASLKHLSHCYRQLAITFAHCMHIGIMYKECIHTHACALEYPFHSEKLCLCYNCIEHNQTVFLGENNIKHLQIWSYVNFASSTTKYTPCTLWFLKPHQGSSYGEQRPGAKFPFETVRCKVRDLETRGCKLVLKLEDAKCC